MEVETTRFVTSENVVKIFVFWTLYRRVYNVPFWITVGRQQAYAAKMKTNFTEAHIVSQNAMNQVFGRSQLHFDKRNEDIG